MHLTCGGTQKTREVFTVGTQPHSAPMLESDHGLKSCGVDSEQQSGNVS